MTESFAPEEIQRRGLMLVLSAPSGTGKTTIGNQLLKEDPRLSVSISVTTRKPRPGEADGQHYRFIDQTEFDVMVNRDQLLEYARVYSNCYYGTPRLPVENALADGQDVLFVIDWQGARQLTSKMRNDLVSIFILPPSWHELERRLYFRGQDEPVEINRRMSTATEEISHWNEYDYVVVNQDLSACVASIKAILQSERLKRVRQTGLPDFVTRLRDTV